MKRALAFAALLLACNGSSSTSSDMAMTPVLGSCDLRTAGNYCQDYLMVPAIQPYKDNCTASGGVWSDSACVRTGALGGCKPKDGSGINWFFAGSYPDSAAVKSACEGSGDTFVTP